MIKITGKLGTHSSNLYEIWGNKLPKIGDKIWIRSGKIGNKTTDMRVPKWSKVTVDDLAPDGKYIWMSLI